MPSARANLPLLFSGQAAKETTVNTALTILEALTVGSVLSRSVTTPPVSPAEGDTYVIPTTGNTGIFIGQENKIAHWYNAAWKFYTPQNGWNVRVIDEDYSAIAFDGAEWIEVSGGAGSGSTPIATNSVPGIVKTDVPEVDPIVYVKDSVDDLLLTKEPIITNLPTSKGGTGVTNTPANFQILLGRLAGNGYELVTLTAGSNVSLVRSAGALTVSATASGQTAPLATSGVSGTVKTDITESDPVVYSRTTVNSLLAGKQASFNILPINKGGTGLDATPATNQILLGSGSAYNLVTLTAGANITFNNVGGVFTISSNTSGGTALARNTVSVTTGILTSGQIANIDPDLGKSFDLYMITTDFPAWVRLYHTNADRSLDASRPDTTEVEDFNPAIKIIHEVFTSVANPTVFISPVRRGVSYETVPSSNIAVAVKNMSGSTRAITVSFTKLTLEN